MYEDLEKDHTITYRRAVSFCKLCNNTGGVTTMHNRTKSIYEFMCSCPIGLERYRNHEKAGSSIPVLWEQARWKPSLNKNFSIYDVELLPDIGKTEIKT
jgi:hypothetical protein